MKINLATKLKEFTRKFRLNEEQYMFKYKELVGNSDPIEIASIDSESPINEGSGKNGFLANTYADSILQKRDEEITTLVKSINELAVIFKDMQSLVLEQGTILDRIDYNIEVAYDNTKKANVSLRKTDEMMKSNCYRNSIIFMLIMIFVLLLLIILRHF